MENQAFDLVRQGRRAEAEAVLTGQEYDTHKRLYAEGIAKVTAAMTASAEKRFKTQHERAFLAVGAVVIALPLLLFAWLGVLRVVRNYLDQRNQAEETLQRTHDRLEVRVHERTAELAKTNAELEARIVERKRTEVELRQAKEAAETAARAKSEFLATMSQGAVEAPSR